MYQERLQPQETEGTSVRISTIAMPHGPCSGVDVAIQKTREILEIVGKREPVYTFNPVVHNHRVNRSFKEMGLVVVADRIADDDWDWSKIPDNSILILPAHGSKPSDTEIAIGKGCLVFDMECLLVTKEHEEIKKAVDEGRRIIFFGKEGHPEPRGSLAQVPNETIHFIARPEDLDSLEFDPDYEYEFFNQTTQSLRDIKEARERAQELIPLIHINSKRGGCYATDNRQNAVEALMNNHDGLLVVGSGDISNNTRNLAKVGFNLGKPSYIVDDFSEIKWKEWFPTSSGIERLALTSGASVPEGDFQEVVVKIEAVGIKVGYQTAIINERVSQFPIKAQKNLQLLRERYQG